MRVDYRLLSVLLLPATAHASEPAPDIVTAWAPRIYQAVGGTPEDDFLLRFDFDGDWNAWNNQENLGGGGDSLQGCVYYGLAETETHYYITYAFFHAYDASVFASALASACLLHENDMEGVIVTVRKDSTARGEFRVMSTEAHGEVYYFKSAGDAGVVLGAGHFDAEGGGDSTTYFDAQGRPSVFIELDGHGVGNIHRALVASAGGPFLIGGTEYDFPGGDGIVYYHDGGAAETPSGGSGLQMVRYQLRPLLELWERRFDRSPSGTYCNKAGENYIGTRGCPLVDLSVAFGGSGSVCLGDNQCLANPPWGWESDDPSLSRGEWFLDPAYSAGMVHLESFADAALPGFLDYLSNPWLQGDAFARFEPPFPDSVVTVGDTVSIGWAASDTGQSPTLAPFVRLEIDRDGAGWSPLVSGADSLATSSGAFSWIVAGPPADEARLRLLVSCLDCSLTIADVSGPFRILDAPTDVSLEPRAGIGLGRSRPNPFTRSTSIDFTLAGKARVTIDVYDVQGRRVRRLVHGSYPRGRHNITWDGSGENSAEVSAGVYFLRLTADESVLIRKMILLR